MLGDKAWNISKCLWQSAKKATRGCNDAMNILISTWPMYNKREEAAQRKKNTSKSISRYKGTSSKKKGLTKRKLMDNEKNDHNIRSGPKAGGRWPEANYRCTMYSEDEQRSDIHRAEFDYLYDRGATMQPLGN